MFINIITPCTRFTNLPIINKSINIPKKNYRWIIVCDSDELPNSKYIPDYCEIYHLRVLGSVFGNGQRNYAIDMVKDGYLYFNDDDTLIHPDLWENIKDLDNDFISFEQSNIDGSLRLKSENIKVGNIDSHNFLVKNEIVGNTRWSLEKYDADGFFAVEVYSKSKKPIHLFKPLSIYNQLKNN